MTGGASDRRPGHAGFTLVEVLTTTVVLVVLLGALFAFFRSQALALSQQERVINMKQNAQIGLDFMIRELRTAGSRPMPDLFVDANCPANVSTATNCIGTRIGTALIKGYPRLVGASGTSIQFLADFRGNTLGSNADGCPDDAGEDVTYTYNSGSGQLTRTSGGTTSVVLDNIAANGFRIRYYRVQSGAYQEMQSGGGALTANEIASLAHVTLSVRTQASSRIPGLGPIRSEQTATVEMRNPAC